MYSMCASPYAHDCVYVCEHVLDCVFEKSLGNPTDRDSALRRLNSSCLEWSGGSSPPP